MITISVAFCTECGRKRRYRVASTRRSFSSARGTDVHYVEQTAYCTKCGAAVYVPEINDANARAREDAYDYAKEKL